MKLTFDPPLQHDGKTCAEMTLQEPTLGQVQQADQAIVGEAGGHVKRLRDETLVAKVGKTDIELVRQMPAGKLKAAATFLARFDAAQFDKVTEPEFCIDLPKRIEKLGRIVDRLELREPRTGEVEEAQRKVTTGQDAEMRAMQTHLICLVAELPRPVIEELPVSVANQASRYLLGFI